MPHVAILRWSRSSPRDFGFGAGGKAKLEVGGAVRPAAGVCAAGRPRPEAEFHRLAYEVPLAWRPAPDDDGWLGPLRTAFAEEAVQHLDDLLLRRSILGDDPARALELAPAASRLFDWAPARAQAEQARLAAEVRPLMPGDDAPAHPAAGAAPFGKEGEDHAA